MQLVNARTGAVAEVADAAVDRRLASGRWVRPGPDGSDLKARWVDHAVAHGADRSEAEAMTKAELVDNFGGA